MDTEIRVDGLTEALRALRKVETEAAQEARDLLREAAKTIQAAAQARTTGRPGGGSYPVRRGMVGRSANQSGAGVTLKGRSYPWAWGAEFGARRAWVFGRVTVQSQLRRRQFPIWRGNQWVTRGSAGPGWIIQPAIRENLDRVLRKVADGLEHYIARTMSESGLRG